MKKVNLGCGNRYAKGWINLDFNSNTTDVISHNLLTPLPFNDNEIDAIYCSHVLEHFSREEGKRLIENCYKKLKFGGILRIVVPDLENICREYLSILENINEDENKKKYEWIIIELLDQLTRNKSGGEMAVFWQKVVENRDDFLIDYIKSRTGTDLRSNKSIQRDITLIDK
ncbi:methyltransferase domain-containing protein, partial [Peptococcaceae bacterium]|nr:methyltransferase domain-containing protein [Peptococcaceae bacterium]